MTLEVSHGTVTWEGNVLALNQRPVATLDDPNRYVATGVDAMGLSYHCEWHQWNPEWDLLDHPADWPNPTTVVAL